MDNLDRSNENQRRHRLATAFQTTQASRKAVLLGFCCGAIAWLFAFAEPVAANNQIYRKLLQSSVWVVQDEATGSGVLIDKEQRLILTNQHVVGNANRVSVFFPAYRDSGFHAERSYYLERLDDLAVSGRVLARDRQRDLALVQIDEVPDRAVQIEFGERAEPGDAVHSIGNPGTSNALWVYTSGTVRANYFSEFQDDTSHRRMQILETDAPINPGDSGGPVVNGEGHLVALVQSMRTDARLVSQCVDISEIQTFLESRGSAQEDVVTAWHQVKTTDEQDVPPHEVEYTNADQPITVFISQRIETYGELSTRRVWAMGPQMRLSEHPELLSELLAENARTKLGGWVLESPGGDTGQLIFVAQLAADLEPNEVSSAVDYVARMALSRKAP